MSDTPPPEVLAAWKQIQDVCSQVRKAHPDVFRSIAVTFDVPRFKNYKLDNFWLTDLSSGAPTVDAIFGSLEEMLEVATHVFNSAIEANLQLRADTFNLLKKIRDDVEQETSGNTPG